MPEPVKMTFERQVVVLPLSNILPIKRVPDTIPQTAAEVRGFSPIASGFTAETDWLLEGSGFEPSVPRDTTKGSSGNKRAIWRIGIR
jgi:hypothetical protein